MPEQVADDLVRGGREALAAAEWERAQACFEAAAAELGETAEVLDGLSEAAHFQGSYERAIEPKERPFAAHRRRGPAVEAADAALAGLHARHVPRQLRG